MRRSSLLVAAIVLAICPLAGCGEEKSPDVDPSTVGPRGALKSQSMQDQMAKYNSNGGGPVPGAADKK